ncbi:MAG: hypothetical protein LBN27_02795 [Prevotellaceae bacterium]|jgi:hypothetical protein|nr:hypothetical protein [Prevotellaceae bacterium]
MEIYFYRDGKIFLSRWKFTAVGFIGKNLKLPKILNNFKGKADNKQAKIFSIV